MKIKEIIVVEGKDDTAKILQTVDADTIETNGSAIDDAIIAQIRHAEQKRGVIIFTDPDYPGERIRHIVAQAVPTCKHAFLPKDQALAKHDKGVGIEHASSEDIKAALSAVYELTEQMQPVFTKQDLLRYGLLGHRHAAERRRILGERLNIGQTNGKQLLKRLNMFNITHREFDNTMQAIIQEEKNEG
ncbi:ribonuclease M5 [Thalassobacillus sp. CUG 92003]|uniref:ribonuclease M5 n=1 Tax=Thalassobacillus sp. CUG 92003 TaxID=2736641 RepID=UPI0015E7BCA2